MKRIFITVFVLLLSFSTAIAQTSDAALRRITEQDSSARDTAGKLQTLSAAEHLARAETYSANRLFPQAREHWQKVFDNYPEDAGMPKALFGTARSYMWEREYGKAVEWFNKLTKDFPHTKDGREGLAFKGASLIRDGKNLDAAKVYAQYVAMFPDGEKIESAHLNIIDAYREAGKYTEAEQWVDKSIRAFPRTPTEANARQALLRMKIHQSDWNGAVAAADSLLAAGIFARSMTTADEARFLKAMALEKAGKKAEANEVYASIPNGINSYYGGLAAERIAGGSQVRKIGAVTPKLYADYPVLYRTELIRQARPKKIDPRFLLAIMKQESVFKAGAKSPAGARGLLQFVFDTALKYNKEAGYPNLQPDDLYKPEISIALGSVYVAELKDEFGGLYEAIAASYNGGEDNAARWLNRSKPKEAGIFAAEVGFAETKNYVFKVMNNYRIYRELYTEDLQRR
ncbi:MAG: transglycosylase SLT domain-containing protein [Saprospiraceae bacterium]|nr:transglycosylase SLT domain-containing protein [Pyrinomonadaceae bacterium]